MCASTGTVCLPNYKNIIEVGWQEKRVGHWASPAVWSKSKTVLLVPLPLQESRRPPDVGGRHMNGHPTSCRRRDSTSMRRQVATSYPDVYTTSDGDVVRRRLYDEITTSHSTSHADI